MSKSSNHPLSIFIGVVPLDALPQLGTLAYDLLVILSDGKPHPRNQPSLRSNGDGDTRSPLQQLRGDQYLNWLVHSVEIKGSSSTYLQLDYRHLSGDSKQDEIARKERKRDFKDISYKGAIQGGNRIPRAMAERQSALEAYVSEMNEAANDSHYEKKPSSKS